MSDACPDCLALIRELAAADPVASQGGILYEWWECQLCRGASFDKDYDEDDRGRARFVHAPDCLWSRARDHAATHAPPVALEHDRIPYGDATHGDGCVENCPACAAEGSS